MTPRSTSIYCSIAWLLRDCACRTCAERRPPVKIGSVTCTPAAAFDVSWSTPTPGTPLFSDRSEEHTSELQSLMRISYAVFCLKKKNLNNTITLQKPTRIPHCTTHNTPTQ